MSTRLTELQTHAERYRDEWKRDGRNPTEDTVHQLECLLAAQHSDELAATAPVDVVLENLVENVFNGTSLPGAGDQRCLVMASCLRVKDVARFLRENGHNVGNW